MTLFNPSLPPKIMGVLNITPDSFYDGGRFFSLDNALRHAHKLVQEGADVLDIGGESTRPNADTVDADEECKRVLPIIRAIKQEIDVPISIDSRHTKVMEEALENGVDMINDVWALQDDGALVMAAKWNVPVCLMHMQGTPQTMQKNPNYEHCVGEVLDFLRNRVEACERAGIVKNNIWVDPGFGFGKTLEHNLMLLKHLARFKSLGCSVMVGLSRKSMFGQLLNLPVDERLHGSLAASVIAALNGAEMIRTHDVAATKEAMQVVSATCAVA